MRNKIFVTLALLTFIWGAVNAKKYPFSIDSQREVYVVRSAAAGTKMVKAIAVGGSADKAIEKAMIDAVAAITFDGINGEGEMDGCPAVLVAGRETYNSNKTYFDNFFRKGKFLDFVSKVNSTYPMGADNVKVNGGRRIQILLIVDWKGLAGYFKNDGFKTAISELSNY
jgi:hypothetical protein